MTYDVTFVELSEQHTAVRLGHVSHLGIADFLGGAFTAVGAALGGAGIDPAGPPFAKYAVAPDGGWVIEAGFPVLDAVEGDGDVVPGLLPGGAVAQTVHTGPYAEMRAAYDAIEAFVAAGGMAVGEDAWESYLDDPMATPSPRTLVVMSVVS
jgi:effector-binding domain-containing protein